METLALERCPACDAADTDRFLLGSHPLLRCRGCDLVYAERYADPDQIYVDGYLKGEGQWGPPNVLDPEFARRLADLNGRRMELLARVLPDGGRLLDVGCGMGELLVAARDAGWEAVGVEPVAASAAYARDERGLDVRTAMLADAGLGRGSFDVVAATHVLEHMPEGRSFLEHVAEWARPGGYVAIEVPNYGSLQRRTLDEGWIGLRPLEHVAHYTPDSLRDVFVRAGLEPVSITSPSYLWPESTLGQALADLGVHRGGRVLRKLTRRGQRDGREVRVPTAPLWGALRATERVLDRTGRGGLVFGIARRPG